mmetsp:Transcript_26265/g.46579  ORF Transcript_26265/g.46579 Transcript_26265/m.46579 type:complete len:187 (-) Transcript_26265:388-948(-)|eukprot:CAMPEP_0197524442 /NCGR_PEP_ID=MMETSP1318-20131121/9121_1 /TAXON_ID=552666 /ORGANISM="Partenskyella glossopodia, Strain RCC365" /LENGTH=186 /DNA_ID=CAMNT_0043077403 /DNA_START=59 /DNA_END=619 /DNA_ORIENTATION=+
MENDLSAQYLLALLKQLVKQTFYSDGADLSEDVKARIFGDSKMAQEKVSDFIGSCMQLLGRAARGNWNQGKMEAELHKIKDLPSDQKKVFLHIWKQEGSKIHKELVAKTIWNNTLDETAWRIDIQSTSKHVSDINEPTAIIRLKLNTDSHQSGGSEIVHCEMNSEGLASIVKELDSIHETINRVSS